MAPAAALTGAAGSLEAAAVALGAGGVPGGVPGKAVKAAGAAAGGGGVGAAVRAVAANPAVWASAAALAGVYAARQLIASTTSDPSGYTNQMLQVAKQQLAEAQRAAATEVDPTRKEEARTQVAALTAQITKLTEQLSYQEGEKQANWVQAAIEAAAKVKPAAEQPGGGVFPTPAKDTTLTTLPTDIKTQLDSAATSWANTVTAGNTAFQTTFGELPAKGAEAGTSMGQGAASTLQGAAGGIGSVIGNSAAAAIKAAVSNLNINVNANVTGAKNSTADKGGSSPD
jgi:hypothetical protein